MTVRHRSASISLAGLLVFSAPGLPCGAQAAPAGPARLEHMNYVAARRIILSYGWKPLAGHCTPISQETCRKFPEVGYCSGVAPGYCAMVFVRRDRCLYVETTGGDPQDVEEGDTHIESVTFQRGPCSKNN